MKSSDVGSRAYEQYKQSKKNLEGDAPDEVDDVVVILWDYSTVVYEENKALKKELDAARQSNANLCRQNDLLESKMEVLSKGSITLPEGWMPVVSVPDVKIKPIATKYYPGAIRVTIIESERGWGTKVDDVKYFHTRAEAEEFCKDFNKDNPTDHAPDWYMQATIDN